ncbi:MAG TPA: hypothetical protein VFQ59_01190 [Candidatus Paceibacterota bacterium]|nr:hypothetical protein [Candidatus Paceibacterota bacterium]
MDILQPSIQQSPVFGNTSPGGSMFLQWEYQFYKFWNAIGDFLPQIFNENTWKITKGIMAMLAMFCFFVLVYTTVRMFEIRRKEHEHLHHEIEEYAHHEAEREKARRKAEMLSGNPRWVGIINSLSSADPAQWKIAIMEADTMLDALMDQLGFQGESLGEKLKSADPKKFRSLSIAWEAHAVRNKIAHEGSDFVITSREAKRIVTLYEQIFREYGFI